MKREASANGDGLMNVLYECDYECMKKTAATKPLLTHAPSLSCIFFLFWKSACQNPNTHFAFFFLSFSHIFGNVSVGTVDTAQIDKKTEPNGVHCSYS